MQVTSSICVPLPENKSLYNTEICHRLPKIVCQLLNNAHPVPHICRNSDFYSAASLLPISDLKEMSLPLSSWAHLKPLPLTVAFIYMMGNPDRFPAWTEDLCKRITCLIFVHFCLWDLEALFSLFVGIQNNPTLFMKPALQATDPVCLNCHIGF